MAWYKALTPDNIVNSFAATGVCPFDRTIIKLDNEPQTDLFRPESLVERSGLGYIPLYSHALRDVSEDTREGSVPLPTTTSISNLFPQIIPPNKIPTKHKKSAGKVLTSRENLQEKEKLKQEKNLQKMEKKRLRIEKAKKKKAITCKTKEKSRFLVFSIMYTLSFS